MTAYETAISAANGVLDNPEATQTQVDEAVTALARATTTASEGTEPGQYKVGSKVTLQTAIEAANAIATKENVTKVEVDQAVTDLQKAVVTFEAGKVQELTPVIAVDTLSSSTILDVRVTFGEVTVDDAVDIKINNSHISSNGK